MKDYLKNRKIMQIVFYCHSGFQKNIQKLKKTLVTVCATKLTEKINKQVKQRNIIHFDHWSI